MSVGPGVAARIVDIGELVLENGLKLARVELAVETWGELNAERSNAVLVTHPFTASAHAASHPLDATPGFWEGLVGPGKGVDTDTYFVICANVIGSCYGSTGPSARNTETGLPYGGDFPAVTIRDMVRAQRQLLTALGINRLAGVVGASMGGMQALEWAASYPAIPRRVVAMAAPGQASLRVIAWNCIARQALELGDEGLLVARMAGVVTYESSLAWERRFGRRVEGGRYAIESYLHSEASSFATRFDRDSLAVLSRAVDSHDLYSQGGHAPERLGCIQCPILLIPVSSDALFPPDEIARLARDLAGAGVDVSCIELHSDNGHDAILSEIDAVAPAVRDFLIGG